MNTDTKKLKELRKYVRQYLTAVTHIPKGARGGYDWGEVGHVGDKLAKLSNWRPYH